MAAIDERLLLPRRGPAAGPVATPDDTPRRAAHATLLRRLHMHHACFDGSQGNLMTDEILKSSMCNVIRPARWTPVHVLTSSLSLLGERKDHGARVRMVNWSYGTCRVYKVLDGRTRTGPCCDAPLCWSLCRRWARALTSERRRATERNGARPAGVGGVALVAAQRRGWRGVGSRDRWCLEVEAAES